MRIIKLLSKQEAADYLGISQEAFENVAKPLLVTYKTKDRKDLFSEEEMKGKRDEFETAYSAWRKQRKAAN